MAMYKRGRIPCVTCGGEKFYLVDGVMEACPECKGEGWTVCGNCDGEGVIESANPEGRAYLCDCTPARERDYE